MSPRQGDLSQPQVKAFVGLGSNLNQPITQIGNALASIASLSAVSNLKASSFYRNPPMGPPDQPDYVNAVVQMETGMTPGELLDRLLEIERVQGRVRSDQHWGPRVIDLDILLFGDLQLESKRLTIPHPGLSSRVFVLSPLYEIAPALVLPDGVRLVDLMVNVDAESLVRIDT